MKRILPLFIGISALTFLAFAFLRFENASAEQATHLVISEVQISGATPDDDFIEIYNPTSSEINLGDMRLIKRTSGGATDTDIVVFSASDVIPARGYYLWCNSVLSGTLNCDKTSTDTLSNNNSVGLRNDPVNTGSLIDAVSFGIVTNTLGEGSSLTAPTASTSVERKANSSSTALSMAIGGLDEFMGNSEDTDDNSIDFLLRNMPQPQNSNSAVEPISSSPTPTTEPSVTPTPTATPIPSVSPTPTNAPSLTPTPTNSPTPTNTPTVTPTSTTIVTPSLAPTSVPSPTPTAIMTPTPTPTGGKVIVQGPIFTCTINYRNWRFFHKTVLVPYLTCIKTNSN